MGVIPKPSLTVPVAAPQISPSLPRTLSDLLQCDNHCEATQGNAGSKQERDHNHAGFWRVFALSR